MIRKIVQSLTLLCNNAYLVGFLEGRIYKGKLKSACVPGLNCYSCPGAVFSCPIGSLQAVLGSYQYSFSFYVTGLLLFFGLLFGRFACGFLCPFGLLQELLHKIPSPKFHKKLWKWLPHVKYVILVVFVLALPALFKGNMGIGHPAFCKYICPAGTLTAGLPLLATQPAMRDAIGRLFCLKSTIAVITVLGCFFIYRFFCKVLCPLGAFYGLFNKFALYRLNYCAENCVHCGACSKACKMTVDPSLTPDSPECIRCGDCVKACNFSALKAGVFLKHTSDKGKLVSI